MNRLAGQISNHEYKGMNMLTATEPDSPLLGNRREGEPDHKVKDLGLWKLGREEIRLAEQEMPGLMALRKEYGDSRPLQGARITGSLHMTVQTAVPYRDLDASGR